MTHEPQEYRPLTYAELAEINRRAGAMRAEVLHRLLSALFRGIRRAIAGFVKGDQAVEPVQIPRSPSSAIF